LPPPHVYFAEFTAQKVRFQKHGSAHARLARGAASCRPISRPVSPAPPAARLARFRLHHSRPISPAALRSVFQFRARSRPRRRARPRTRFRTRFRTRSLTRCRGQPL